MNFVFAIINKNKRGFEMVKTSGDQLLESQAKSLVHVEKTLKIDFFKKLGTKDI